MRPYSRSSQKTLSYLVLYAKRPARLSHRACPCLSQAVEDDTSEETWNNIAVHLPRLVSFIHRSIQTQKKLLIHCDTGISTSLVREYVWARQTGRGGS